MDNSEFIAFFKKCGGTTIQKMHKTSWGSNSTSTEYIFPEDLDLSTPIYIKVTGGPLPRHGAIGRFVEFVDESIHYITTPRIKIEWDYQNKTYIDRHYRFQILDDDYSDGTKWVWKTEKHDKKEKPPVLLNKFGQELEIGSLIVGVQKVSKKLRFGYVTRYTAHNIWINPIHFPCDGREVDEIQLDNNQQTCLFEEDFLEHLLVHKLMS